MQCFSHRDVAAVGICKSCGKGLCPACAREIERGLVCSDACAEAANINLQIVNRATKLYSIGQRPKVPLVAWLFGVVGALFEVVAFVMWWGDPSGWPAALYFAVAGVLFGAFAVFVWRRYRAVGLSL
jgi:hypothetical protein